MTFSTAHEAGIVVMVVPAESLVCRGCLIMSRIRQTTVEARERISIVGMSLPVEYMTPPCSAAHRMNTDTIATFFCMAIVLAIR